MEWDRRVHSAETVRAYEFSRRLYRRLAVLAAVYVVIDAVVFAVTARAIAIVAAAISILIFGVMATHTRTENRRAEERLEDEKRRWLLGEEHRS
jgi:hypothetical protein